MGGLIPCWPDSVSGPGGVALGPCIPLPCGLGGLNLRPC
jgi:hypothetical protein